MGGYKGVDIRRILSQQRGAITASKLTSLAGCG